MRYLAGVIGLASVIAVSAATAGFSSQEAAVETTRAAFRKAKPDEIKSTETYCARDILVSGTRQIMRQAIQLMAVDERIEANGRCERRGRDSQTEVRIESKYRDHRDRGPM